MGKPRLPMVLPSGTMLIHMSACRRRRIMDELWESVGGFERAQAWIEKSDANYETFFKDWMKGSARHMQIEHSNAESTEDMVDEVERSERAQVIGGNFTESDDDDKQS